MAIFRWLGGSEPIVASPRPLHWSAIAIPVALLVGVIVAEAVLAHDWYTDTWNSLGGRCCGGNDCRALTSDEIRTQRLRRAGGADARDVVAGARSAVVRRDVTGRRRSCLYRTRRP